MTIVRLGAQQGADTDWRAASPGVTLHTFDGTTALDACAAGSGLGPVDLVWAEIPVGNGYLVRGAAQTLSMTRLFYARTSAGEPKGRSTSLRALLAMLPDSRIVELLWPEHVLLHCRAK